MKKILLPAFFITLMGAVSCSGQYPQENNHVSVSPLSKDVNIQADQNNAAFDVNALANIVQKTTNPSTLEQEINDPANNINNLDLDKDGQIDFLTVTETGQNELQINDAAVNPPVTVARLTMTPENGNTTSTAASNTATLRIDGTPDYCGPYYYYYRPHISFGTMLFMAYLLRPHPYYVPMWGYRHYPHYYTTHRTVVRTVYRPTRSAYTPVQRNYYSNRSSLSSPRSSRRSFNERSYSKPVGSGGFGNSRSTNSGFSSGRSSGFGSSRSSGFGSSSRSWGSSSGSSRRSFGSSRSSWGSRSSGSSRSSFSRSSGRSFGRRR